MKCNVSYVSPSEFVLLGRVARSIETIIKEATNDLVVILVMFVQYTL